MRGFELTPLVVIGTDCTGSYKSNYHTIMTTKAPLRLENNFDLNTSLTSANIILVLATSRGVVIAEASAPRGEIIIILSNTDKDFLVTSSNLIGYCFCL